MAKLRLGFYPYTFARVSVMKGDLIRPAEWGGLLKMGPSEVVRRLQDTQYRKEIDELGAGWRDIAALELALHRNLMRAFKKLYQISDENLQQVLRTYLERYDLENYKMIVRAKTVFAAEDATHNEDVQGLLLESVNHPREHFISLLQKKDVHEILDALPFKLSIRPNGIHQNAELFEIENALDEHYFTSLMELAEQLGGQGIPMKHFIRAELDIINIKIILQLKKENILPNEIKKHLIHPHPALERLAGRESIQSIARGIEEMGYVKPGTFTGRAGQLGDSALTAETSAELLVQLERELDLTLLRKETRLMHLYPLTVNVFLGFMFAKEAEIRNLKALLKGKQLGLDEKYIEKLLVI